MRRGAPPEPREAGPGGGAVSAGGVARTLGIAAVALVLGRLRELLGEDAEVEVAEVADIPPLPSGKRPIIVRSYEREAGAEDAE